MEKKLKVLLIEDSENDMLLIKRELQRGKFIVDMLWIQTIEEIIKAIKDQEFDVIISDYNLHKFNGSNVLSLFKEFEIDIPFILVSGTVGEDIAVQVMKNGANDYIMKDKLKRLVPAIEREIKDCRIRQDYKKAEQALKQSEVKFRKIFENIQDVYFQIDLLGNILEISPSVERYSGYKREELIGKSLNQFYFDFEERTKFLNEVSKYGEIRDFEIRLKVKEKKFIYCSVNAHILYDNDNMPIALEGSLRDISDRKQAEIELINAFEKAEESDHLKTAFLQNISHEIRTPLNGIIGFSKLLQSENLTKEEIIEFTGIIQQSSIRLLEIVQNVLDISKIETGQIEIKNKTFCINALIDDLYSMFSPIANEKGIILKFQNFSDDENCLIFADENKLNQIFTNLINNAIKFTHTGYIDFGYKFKENIIEFFVKDTGMGICLSDQKIIFERFTQIDLSITRGYEGAGLGLAICKGLLEFMNGSIWLESDVKQGTTFFFNIPLLSAPKNENILKSSAQLSIKSKKKANILITDDDLISFKLIKRMLDKSKFEVFHAFNGKQSLEFVKNNLDLDLILMDIKMPDMDGYEATNKIKNLRPDLPVIAHSAFGFLEKSNNSNKACFDDYLIKPFEINQFTNIIDKYLN
jgi:PAS domain S-box-containing protein